MRGDRACEFSAASTRLNEADNTAEMTITDDSGSRGGTPNGSIDHIGTRAADPANAFFFDAYTTSDAGV
jgi:hypothetical protein